MTTATKTAAAPNRAKKNGDMLAVRKLRPGPGAEIVRVPVPSPGPGEVLIRVQNASICGTDHHIYAWNSWAASRVRTPHILGHEVAGVIEEIGEGVHERLRGKHVSVETHFYCGQCTACAHHLEEMCQRLRILGVDTDGCFAEYCLAPAANVWINDPKLPSNILSLQEPLGNAIDTVLSDDVTGKSLLLTGCGPIGLLGVAVAVASGAGPVIVTDVQDYRLDLAKKLGANVVLNPRKDEIVNGVRNATDGRGADVVCEMSGNAAAFRQAFEAAAPGGRVSLLGLPDQEIALDWNNLVLFKRLTVMGIYGRKIFETWEKAKNLLSSGRLDIRPVITHELPLAEIEQAMRLMESGKCGKIVLHTGG